MTIGISPMGGPVPGAIEGAARPAVPSPSHQVLTQIAASLQKSLESLESSPLFKAEQKLATDQADLTNVGNLLKEARFQPAGFAQLAHQYTSLEKQVQADEQQVAADEPKEQEKAEEISPSLATALANEQAQAANSKQALAPRLANAQEQALLVEEQLKNH